MDVKDRILPAMATGRLKGSQATFDARIPAALMFVRNTYGDRNPYQAVSLRFCRLWTRSSTTAGSASVDVSPKLSN